MTGTPGTGKTAIAKALAASTGAKLIDANALVKSKGLWSNKAKHEANLAALKRVLVKEIKRAERSRGGFVAEGHLLCEFALPCDACVVLRCHPRELARRLEKRGYAKRKIAENVLCEILDYCVVRAESAYGARRVAQVNATRRVSARRALDAAAGKKSDSVNWAPLLPALLENKAYRQ